MHNIEIERSDSYNFGALLNFVHEIDFDCGTGQRAVYFVRESDSLKYSKKEKQEKGTVRKTIAGMGESDQRLQKLS